MTSVMQLGVFLRDARREGIKPTEEELREDWERRETWDPKWLDWIKMAGVKKHLCIYTVILAWLYMKQA